MVRGRNDPLLRRIDPATGALTGSAPLTLPGFAITGGIDLGPAH